MFDRENDNWVNGIDTGSGSLAVFDTVRRYAVEVAPVVPGGNGAVRVASATALCSPDDRDEDGLCSGVVRPHSGAAIPQEVTV